MTIEIRYHEPRFSQKAIKKYHGSHPVETNFSELFWTLWPSFRLTPHGLFLLRNGTSKGIKALVRERGRFSAEGLVNHIHLQSIVKDPILQFEIGVKAISNWAHHLDKMTRYKKVVIYLNEGHEGIHTVDFMLCIYSDPSIGDIRRLEKAWRHPVKKLPLKTFLKKYEGGDTAAKGTMSPKR